MNFSVTQLVEFCIKDVIPQIGSTMLSDNSKSICSFFETNNIDSNKLFSMKPIELRDSLVTHCSDIKRGPANHLFNALKARIHKEEIFDIHILNELIKQGIASKYEIAFASKETKNYKEINEVLFTLNKMKKSNFYNKVTQDKMIPADYGPPAKLVTTKQFLQSAHSANINILYKIREHDVLICGYCRLYLSMDVVNYIAKYYFSVYSYANMIKLSGCMSITPIDCKGGYLLKPTSYFPTARIDIPVKKQCGKYYYEFVVDFVSVQSLAQIGWIDSECKPNNSKGVGDDQHSWSYDGGRRKKWHVRRVGGSGGVPYGKKWHVNDVVGCAVHVKRNYAVAGRVIRNVIDIEFYLNGESLGKAYEICTYKGNLYAAFTSGQENDYGTIVFDKDKLKFMPDEYQPIF